MGIQTLLLAMAVAATPNADAEIAVELDAPVEAPQSGRLLVFASPATPGAADDAPVDTSLLDPERTGVAAVEVDGWAPGETRVLPQATSFFPRSFGSLKPGRYRVQAVLDRDGNYNYAGRGAGDIVSATLEAQLPGPFPSLRLTTIVPASDLATAVLDTHRRVRPVSLRSVRLSRFWREDVRLNAWIALPPDYRRAGASYPTVYVTLGFGDDLAAARAKAVSLANRMAVGTLPSFIWVVLDQSFRTGTHEFADSANNGPWGTALTRELMPFLEKKYRMKKAPKARFLTGYSSGGWSCLWLQTRYPDRFGGCWAAAPDPADFRDFTGVNLYAQGANLYRTQSGAPVPLLRYGGQEVASMEQAAKLEQALGPRGGQFSSFEWVFSPRSPNGEPKPLFERATGLIDPEVARYWRDNYDIAERIRRGWRRVGSRIKGKLNVFVGEDDNFHLDGSARRFEEAMKSLKAQARFVYLPDKDHLNLYEENGDQEALLVRFAHEMAASLRE